MQHQSNILVYIFDSQGVDDTTPNALNFALLFMVRNRDVIEKVQLEIDSVLGSRSPTLADKDNLPFTQVTREYW